MAGKAALVAAYEHCGRDAEFLQFSVPNPRDFIRAKRYLDDWATVVSKKKACEICDGRGYVVVTHRHKETRHKCSCRGGELPVGIAV